MQEARTKVHARRQGYDRQIPSIQQLVAHMYGSTEHETLERHRPHPTGHCEPEVQGGLPVAREAAPAL
jgi:hypothetical protein